jgi:hypothetical protein
MACPVIEMLAEATSGSRGFGTGGGCDIGGEGEIVGRPSGGRLACGATMGITVRQILLVVVMSGVGTQGMECWLALVLPDPCFCGYDVVEEWVKIKLVQLVVGKEEVPGFVAEFCQ